MSKVVHVDLGDRSYDIHIGQGMDLGELFNGARAPRALLVSDSNVGPLHGASCEAALRTAGAVPSRCVVAAGEESKTLACAAELYGQAIDAGLDRKSVIVALGGGMVGDLAGFVAATFLRGIRLVQLPTSLLAMVDSSVGGKTGVNLDRGKNLVGVFHQPVAVCADLTTLETLPEREYRSGLAEVVKYGVIWDAEFFAELEKQADKLCARDPGFLEFVVGRCCEIKAEVVAIDERESGVREILNFGHTLGHAVELVSGYGRWLHGEAVATGMLYAARLSEIHRGFPETDAARLEAILVKLGFDPAAPLRDAEMDWPALREAMAADKKTRNCIPRFVLADRLGAVVFGCEVEEAVLERAYGAVMKS